MKTIPLTQGQVAIVDDADYTVLAAFKWFAWWSQTSRVYYARRNKLLREGPGRPSVFMHHAILPCRIGFEVDHVNRATLDNRRENLRYATTSQNTSNRRRLPNMTGLKGVYSNHGYGFMAQITVMYKKKYLGNFEDPLVAARAYDSAALKHFGEFAVINGV